MLKSYIMPLADTVSILSGQLLIISGEVKKVETPDEIGIGFGGGGSGPARSRQYSGGDEDWSEE